MSKLGPKLTGQTVSRPSKKFFEKFLDLASALSINYFDFILGVSLIPYQSKCISSLDLKLTHS
jgi:hypothetical protein